jgi:hypothetical protein
MNDIVNFIRAHHIDSFQKLRFLIFLCRHSESSWSIQQIAEQLCLGDIPLLEGIIADMRATGLVDCAGDLCALSAGQQIRSRLRRLDRMCEDPQARQQILSYVRRSASWPG